jgi:outer membrane lipoprotein carrier protein LolA
VPRLATTLIALAIAAPLYAAADPGATTVDSDWILSHLARPAPMHTAFVELRDSKLLKAPLRIQGEYRRPSNDTLVRDVRAPYVETTTIRAGTVSIARAGKSPRTFSLARVPELAGMQASFGALLSGDRQQLQQHYRIASSGTRQHWVLTLTPKDAAFAAKVRDIVLHGRGAELRCIETASTGGSDVQRTLLAGAARDASTATTSAALAELCHGAP